MASRRGSQVSYAMAAYCIMLFFYSTFHFLAEFKEFCRIDIAPEYKRHRFTSDLGRTHQNGARFLLRIVCFSPSDTGLAVAS